MTTIAGLFASAVAARETEPALRTANGTIAWTRGDYGRQAAAAATGLSALGVGRGDVVACWLRNRASSNDRAGKPRRAPSGSARLPRC